VFPERRTLPNSKGSGPVEDTTQFMQLMLQQGGIETYVESHDIQIKRSNIILTGESAGAMFALRSLNLNPKSFAGALFRSPLVGDFTRELGQYMGRDVDPEDVLRDIQAVVMCLERLGEELPPGISIPPPWNMWPSPIISFLKVFPFFWDKELSIDLLDEDLLPPGCEPFVLILHGSDDRFVELSSSKELHKRLERKGYRASLSIWAGQDHCFDREISLYHRDMQPLRQFFCSVFGAGGNTV
jgi:acetyl esterase/lipase